MKRLAGAGFRALDAPEGAGVRRRAGAFWVGVTGFGLRNVVLIDGRSFGRGRILYLDARFRIDIL